MRDLISFRRLPPKVQSFYRMNEMLVVFLFRILLLIFFWKLLFHIVWNNQGLLEQYNEMSLLVIDFILHCCAFILEQLQYNVEIDSFDRLLRVQGTVGVTVGEPCIGYDLSALYVGLIVACKGPLLKKTWVIPVGVAIICCLNFIRICVLAVLVIASPEIWELNHKVIFTVTIYAFIFLMWRYWLKISDSLGVMIGNDLPKKENVSNFEDETG